MDTDRKTAYIIVHGFCGSPKDVISIKRELEKNGIREQDIFRPFLKGHYSDGKIKFNVTYQEIVSDLTRYVAEKSEDYDDIIMIGYSMGGLVAICVALEIKISKLILINVPIHIWNFKNLLWTLETHDFKDRMYHVVTLASCLKYKKIRCSMKLRKLQKFVFDHLSNLDTDTLIIQSTHDYVARPSGADELYQTIKSKKKEIRWYSTTTHYIPDEEEIVDVVNYSVNWINSCEDV